MKFCSECGSGVALRIPEGDTVPRYVCESCSAIHYSNPNIVAGCIVEHGDQILLCKRAIEPRRGLWTLPAGFMENGESVENAAARETLEEACATVSISGLYAVYSIPHVSQVYMIFRARLEDGNFAPGLESLEVELYKRDEIPWETLAFKVVYETLRSYYRDKDKGHFPTYVAEIIR